MYSNLNKFIDNIPNHDYETRSGNSFNPVFQRLTLTQKQSLKFQGPKTWNSIPDYIRAAPSLSIFKRKYKKILLSSYSND